MPSSSSAEGRLPTFVIAGTMKSGTSSLASWIGDHPQGFVAPVKEVHYFNADDHYSKGVGWYRSNFEGADDAVAVGDATPLYSFYPEAVERMASLLPEARVIVCMRNPIDRAYSHYRHWYYRRVHEDRTWEQVVEDELADPDPGPPDPRGGAYDPKDPRYLQQGHYAEQLERLCSFYPREQVMGVLTDDLKKRPHDVYREVCEFLGMDPERAPDTVGVAKNESFEFRPARFWRWSVKHRFLERLPGPTGKFIAINVMRRPVRYKPMDPALRVRLAEHFAPRNAALADWLGREINWS
jgi:hypothetical protein